MSEKDLPDPFRSLSEEEYEKLPRLSKEEVQAVWRKVREDWERAMSAPRPRIRFRNRFYRRRWK